MKIAQMTVTRWRTGKHLPVDGQMRELARLAGADEEVALVLLNIWRAKDEPTRDTYRRLLRRFAGGSGAAIAVAVAFALACPAEARDSAVNWSLSEIIRSINVYYGKLRAISRRVAAALRFSDAVPA